jgi:hypothetical protein
MRYVLAATIALVNVACARSSKEDRTSPPGESSAANPHAVPRGVALASSAPAPSSLPAASVRERCPSRTDDTIFFPLGSLGPREPRFDQDAFRRQWYSTHLRAMQEPSLSCGAVETEAYRFLWLRTFHAPIAVRLAVTGKMVRLASVQLSGAGGYSPGTVVDRSERMLLPAEWDQVHEALNLARFWSTSSWQPSAGADGAQWIIEGRLDSRYHVVDRWSPRAGTFRSLGLLLLRIADISVPNGDVY